MNQHTRWALGLGGIAVVGTYALLASVPSPPEPFANCGWKVESVMLLDPATTTTYALAPPFRVIRDGRVTVARRDEISSGRVVRVDLTIEGEPVILFTRIRE
jgi:hypothetical protein